jgi:hypothetical protein
MSWCGSDLTGGGGSSSADMPDRLDSRAVRLPFWLVLFALFTRCAALCTGADVDM